MPKLIFHVLAFLLLFISFDAEALNNDTSSVARDFSIEIKEMMDRTKSQSAIALSNEFLTLWGNGSLSTVCKINISAMGTLMKERNLPAIPYYVNFIKLINNLAGGKISIDKSEKLLPLIEKSLAKVDNPAFNQMMIRLNDFLEHQAIYYSSYYKLYFTSSDFDFEYIAVEEQTAELNLTDSVASGSKDLSSSSNNDWVTQAGSDTTGGWGNDGMGNNNQWGDNSGSQNVQSPTVPGAGYSVNMVSNELLPAEKGLIVKFNNTDLVFVTPYDSAIITGTTGSWMVNEKIFLGKGGSFDWSVAGFEPGKISTLFDKYYLNIDRPLIAAENVKLNYPDRLDEPIAGIFDYFSSKPDRSGTIHYPVFTAYENNHQIKFPDNNSIKVKGGFSVSGKKMTTRSLSPGRTLVEITEGANRKLKAIGSLYALGDSLLYSANTSLTIYQGKDSICHPAVKLTYYINSKKLLAEKCEGEFSQTPFLASYYKMEIGADAIQWDMKSDSLDVFISQARNIVPASFTSYDYFDKDNLRSLSKPFNFNPLLLAVNYSRKKNTQEFDANEMAKFYKQNPVAVKASMVALMQNNFISYDPNTSWVIMKDKAFHYADENKGSRDFDELVINSISGAPKNSTLDLTNNQLTIRGINKFYVSQVLDVFILPDSNEISLLNNRDFKFNGRLFAGNFEFVGRDFQFKYDSFYVDLTHIDSIRFYIDDPKTGQKRRVDNKLVTADTAQTGALTDLTGGINKNTGRLFINLPDNKSGRKIYPGYPTFNAAQGAIVYFNSKEILNGAYDQSVYFVIPPFKIDSLSDSDPATIGFSGKFYSGGLLPPFDETLHVMKDNSLGFVHVIAPEGYNLYGGSGRIYNQLHIDKNGITAKGNIQYLTSSLNSDSLTFYLDSLTGNGYNFKMQEGELNGGSFPDASIESFRMNWMPKKDSMFISNLFKPFNLYNKTATLNGVFKVNQKGAYGKGELDTRNSITKSNQFYFNQTKLGARHAKFDIQSNDPNKPILAGNDIRLFFNLEENYADIGPEVQGRAAIDFPYAQFKTSIPTMRWNLQNRTVNMQKPDNVDIGSSYFYATRKDLDSLAFNATSASYNIDNFQLLIKGIPYIKVADAKITPENNQVLVLENARIGTLKNTKILIDTLNGYHNLYDGTIDIISRNQFEGSATYRFVNTVMDTFAIKIDQFELVKDKEKGENNILHTMASGFVNDQDGVVISPGIVYKGKAVMYAPDPAIALDGYIKLQYRQNPQKDIWIEYKSSETNTQKVEIDFKSARTEEGDPLIAGMHYDQNGQLYSTFANPRKSAMDVDFFVPDGILSYNPDSSVYRIEDSLKVSGDSYQGRIFDLNIKTNDLNFEGPVNFNIVNKDLEIQSAGIGKGNILNDQYNMDAFLTINYNIPSQSVLEMANQIIAESEKLGLSAGYDNDPSLLYKVSELIGEKLTEDYEKRSLQDYLPLVSMSPRLEKTLCLSKVEMNYNVKNKAWYSSGMIGVSNIGKQDVNLMTHGFLEIKKSENGDVVNLFLQFSPDIWYYYNFEENRLMTASSNPDFNDIIKGKSSALKANFGEYFFLNGEHQDVLAFINRFRQEYLGITSPYDLNTVPDQSSEEKNLENKPSDKIKVSKEVPKEEKKKDDEGF